MCVCARASVGLYRRFSRPQSPSLPLSPWVYLHVRDHRFMTMDYLLLLCSLLLPVVCAVEGKTSHSFSLFITMDYSAKVSQHPLAPRSRASSVDFSSVKPSRIKIKSSFLK